METKKGSLIDQFKNKKTLVTGGTGTIGGAIVDRLLTYHNPEVVRVLSNDEYSMFDMQQRFGDIDTIRYLIGDIRDEKRMVQATDDIDIVFHCGAMKHVPFCEYNPMDAIQTNIIGTNNVITASLQNGIEKMITISTDKAVNPTNTMGATKLLTEKLTVDANFIKGNRKTIFCCVRFGNVIISRGSVIDIFKKQSKEKNTIPVTEPGMTRFVMSSSDSVDLIFKSTEMTKGGEIFILKMPSVTVGDLSDAFIEKELEQNKTKIEKHFIGIRPGEKFHEELMTDVESTNAFETKDMFIVFPQISESREKPKLSDYKGATKCKPMVYDSYKCKKLNKNEIKKLIPI